MRRHRRSAGLTGRSSATRYDAYAKRWGPINRITYRRTPRAHQTAPVARIVSEAAVLLAHEVGAGKTAEMVIGSMELRRLGMASKPAVVVPNYMLEQFSREWMQLLSTFR